MRHHHHYDHHSDHGRHDAVDVAGDRALLVAVVVNALLTAAEVAGGILAGSLALIADALHNLSDAASLALALFARRVARRPADAARTFGYRRAEVIGALVSVTALLVMAGYLVVEAVGRLLAGQPPISGPIMVVVSLIALAIDAATAALTYAMSRSSVNIRAAFLHNLADAAGSVATLVVGFVIWKYDWRVADLIATLLIAAYILWQSAGIVRFTVHLLLDGAPPGVDPHAVAKALQEAPGVLGAHHVHARLLDEKQAALEAHVVIDRTDAPQLERIKRDAKRLLRERFNIAHSTLEFEYADETHPERCVEEDVVVGH
ncbi:MAG: cation transporter [Planctomycetota bacterium]|nr:MAG: cation transporter [Planctomycetota bacterium]